MKKQDKDYLSSLKSIETENYIDRAVYRPIGYILAKPLSRTTITPNMVTIASIFVGILAGPCFLYNSLALNLAGIGILITANIMDCIDGQLARLTGIKSEVGRILDGLAGDLWFASVYICLIIRLTGEYPAAWWGNALVGFLLVGICSGVSHLIQAAITDYYKTVHLFFISPEKGKEFESSAEIRQRLDRVKPGINRIITGAYLAYTQIQEFITPALQMFLATLRTHYPDPANIPLEVRRNFRNGSKKVMRIIDGLTFNGRTIPLFIIILTGEVWIYFVFEIVILNVALIFGIRRHEAMCKKQMRTFF